VNRKFTPGRERCRPPIQYGGFGNKRKVGNQFTTAPLVACKGDALQFRMCLAQSAFRVFKEERRSVHVAAASAAAQDSEVLQDLRLQCASQPFHTLEAVYARGLLQFRKRGDAQLFVKLEDFFRPQAGYREHLKDAGGNVLAHGFKAGMHACSVQLRDYIRDSIADPRNFSEAAVFDDLAERHHKGGKTIRRTSVGLGPVGVTAA
jgi:hypothetical protein